MFNKTSQKSNDLWVTTSLPVTSATNTIHYKKKITGEWTFTWTLKNGYYSIKYMGKIFDVATPFKQLAIDLTHCHRKRRKYLVLNLKHEDKGIVALCKFKLNLSNDGYSILPLP